MSARSILSGLAEGPIIACSEALSFWGGVDPASGRVIDVHHPLHGQCLTGAILLMPTSRGSCSGSGVLLDLALSGRAPAALIFSEAEDVLTLGALVAAEMFDRSLPVLRVTQNAFAELRQAQWAHISPSMIEAGDLRIEVQPPAVAKLELTYAERTMLEGTEGVDVQQAMRILCAMAAQQGAERLTPVSQAHIDGCIYASPANLIFAEKMAALGGRVRIPTTMNAISVDRENWQAQGVPFAFGGSAARLADAYTRMGCRSSFTCAPYLLDSAPVRGETIGWSESNAVIFANSVLGARTAKHPDFLDLCIALTGRAPLAGVYLDAHRKAETIIDVEVPNGADDAVWPLIGYLAGQLSPDRIPLLRLPDAAKPSRDDLKALCAAFGTTSAAAMLHIQGVTPEAMEAHSIAEAGADVTAIRRADLVKAWGSFNQGPDEVDLIAVGSPHASLQECRALAAALEGADRRPNVDVIVTAGRHVIAEARAEGILARLEQAHVRVLPDLCWCSISEPVFPPRARTIMTNSGKYAHYGPGLSGRALRFGSLADCAAAAKTGRAPAGEPSWLR